MTRVAVDGRTVTLDDADLLGEGGEGRVFRYGPDAAIKVFSNPAQLAGRAKKLEAFPTGLPPEVLAPLGLVRDPKRGEVVGYVMRRVDGAFDVGRLAERGFRAREHIDADAVTSLFEHAGRVLASLHARGLRFGDLNAGNLLVTRRPGALSPHLIDADSMELPGFPCVVGHLRTVHPALYGRDLAKGGCFTEETDHYALAVLLFESLLHVHPYGGVHPTYTTLRARAAARVSVFSDDVVLPKIASRPSVLDDELRAYFEETFARGVVSPLPVRLAVGRSFRRCPTCGIEHAHKACPTCGIAPLRLVPARAPSSGLRAETIAERKSPFVAVRAEGRAALFATLEGRRLSRESGATVDLAPYFPEDAGLRFDLEPHTTLVVSDDRAISFDHGTGKAHEIATPKRGRTALASTNGEILRVREGIVERLRAGTRAGAVLDGLTTLFAGRGLVLATYRVGSTRFAFVASAARGPLRQVRLAARTGKTRRTFALFDDRHALLGELTDDGTRDVMHLDLVDDLGHLCATTTVPMDAPSPLARAEQGALSAGRLLVPADVGLVLYGASRGAFSHLRDVPEAAPHLPALAELHATSTGDVLVASGERIVRLVLTP
ncbi:MAG: hypothetical protein U0183_27815 [Polyangiaceae bacterium]